jgi:hypothetical protein
LNPIELFWAWVKGEVRACCKYTFPSLLKTVPEKLMECPLDVIKKFFMHCLRYMLAYQFNLTGPLLDYAVKQYKGHRCIRANQIEQVKENFEAYQKEKQENTKHVICPQVVQKPPLILKVKRKRSREATSDLESEFEVCSNSDADSIATGVSSLIDINQVIQDISDEGYQKKYVRSNCNITESSVRISTSSYRKYI